MIQDFPQRIGTYLGFVKVLLTHSVEEVEPCEAQKLIFTGFICLFAAVVAIGSCGLVYALPLARGRRLVSRQPPSLLRDIAPLHAPISSTPEPQAEITSAALKPLPEAQGNARDPLTGLPTEREFAAKLQTAIRKTRNGGAPSSLLLINLQGRQSIIARDGPKIAGQALCEITHRLEGMLKKSEMLARLGDDDFAVIAEGQADYQAHRDAASRMAARMIHNIRQPFPANDSELSLNATIGIALCRPGIAGASELLQNAAHAMHRAKGRAAGFGYHELWQEALPAEEVPLEDDVARALLAGEILPYYQPVIEFATNRICGFEALARWRHKTRGFVSPEEFVPALERLGKMRELTNAILTQVCRDSRAWPPDVNIAINVSPSELTDPLLAQRILRIAEQQEMPPTRLEIEITETALVDDIPAAKASLLAFRQAGILTALDDFGTGYASLGQLRQLKFDRLKIDQSFVHGMLDNAECDKIVDAILGLARSMNLQTVAEGIETQAASASLASRGCDFGQGYYFSKALNAQSAGALLKTGLRRPVAA